MTTTIPVLESLIQGGFIDPARSKKISNRCRDLDVSVFQDVSSGVIYLDPSLLNPSMAYYEDKEVPSIQPPRNDMDWADVKRRAQYLAPFIANKRWLDFGCGPGYQLRESASIASAHLGIEPNKCNQEALKKQGFEVSASINQIRGFSPEVISLFHVLEHLSDPVSTLQEIADNASPNATLLVEVPHANDALLHNRIESFRNFTLWSEHLVLHTRQSLAFIVEQAGWKIIEISGTQRYPVWNHMTWATTGKPSGLKSSLLDSTAHQLHQAYESYLSARDITDTLVAFAIRKTGNN